MNNKTINKLFSFAAQEKAERMVITPSAAGLSFSCHLPDGEESVFNLPKKLASDLSSDLRRLLKIAPDELASGKYCQIHDPKYQLDFRVSILPDRHGEKIVINIINKNRDQFSLNKLGWQRAELLAVRSHLKARSGLILVSSAADQGRSTTLGAMLREISGEDQDIYAFGLAKDSLPEGVNGLADTPENRERLLKIDSNIIFLDGEATPEKLRWAAEAANTGRLVIMTIEAVNALEALYKFLQAAPPLPSSLRNLKMISGQELAPLKRAAAGRTKKNNRPKIGLFELLIPDAAMIDFIKKQPVAVKTADFWKKFSRLAAQSGYRPCAFDRQLKKKSGII